MFAFVKTYVKGHLPSLLLDWVLNKLLDTKSFDFVNDLHCACITKPNLRAAIEETFMVSQFGPHLFRTVDLDTLREMVQSGNFQVEDGLWVRAPLADWGLIISELSSGQRVTLLENLPLRAPLDGLLFYLKPDWIPSSASELSGDQTTFTALTQRMETRQQLLSVKDMLVDAGEPTFGASDITYRVISLCDRNTGEIVTEHDAQCEAEKNRLRAEINENENIIYLKGNKIVVLEGEVGVARSELETTRSELEMTRSQLTDAQMQVRNLERQIESMLARGREEPAPSRVAQDPQLIERLQLAEAYEEAMAAALFDQFIEFKQPFVLEWSKSKKAPKKVASPVTLFDFVDSDFYAKGSSHTGQAIVRPEVATKIMQEMVPGYEPPLISSKPKKVESSGKKKKISRDNLLDLDQMMAEIAEMRVTNPDTGFGVTVSDTHHDDILPYLVQNGVEPEDIIDLVNDPGSASTARAPTYIIDRSFMSSHRAYPNAVIIILRSEDQPNIEPKKIPKQLVPSSYIYEIRRPE